MTRDSDAKPWDWRLKLKLRHSTTNRHRHALLLDTPEAERQIEHPPHPQSTAFEARTLFGCGCEPQRHACQVATRTSAPQPI